ncbi:MAG TPA: ABC-type transport auxiliary lipoprotein family protein [Allosphingosinicella sp.]|jgi:cholesterol transport system auxiliary component
MAYRTLLPAAAALLLSACSFGPKTPPVLMRLTAEQARPAGTTQTSTAAQTMTVVPPAIPQELRTARVPVRTGGTAVAYLKNAQWVENPDALFARLIGETISARSGRVVLDARQFTLDPGLRLTGTLQSFGIDADTSEAVVIYDGVLARGTDGIESRRFEARVAMPLIDAASAGPALNQAANRVAAEVAAWVG